MRRSVLRAIESAKPLARVPRSASRSFATLNESKVRAAGIAFPQRPSSPYKAKFHSRLL